MLPGRVIAFRQRSDPASELSSPRSVVVLVGRDPDLLRLRAKIIASAGYVVQFMTPDRATAEAVKTGEPQVWVFCHTLEFYELALLAAAVRNRSPEGKLLRLTGFEDFGNIPGLFDEMLEPVTGVDDLLRVVSNLAKQAEA